MKHLLVTLALVTACGSQKSDGPRLGGSLSPQGGTITSVQPSSGGGLAGGGTGGSVTLGLLTSCSSTQVLVWNGTAWVCGASAPSNTITGTVTSGDITVATGAHTIGNYGGSDAGSCSLGYVVTDVALGANGSQSTTCTPIGSDGGVTGSGSNYTMTMWTGTTSIGNSLITTDASGDLNLPTAALTEWSTDTGIARNAAGVLEIDNGTAGTYADLRARDASFGLANPSDGSQIQVKNTDATKTLSGIEIAIDTTVAAGQKGGVTMFRGAGGGIGGANEGGLVMTYSGTSFPFSGVGNNDVALFAEGGRILLGADSSYGIDMIIDTSGNVTVKNASTFTGSDTHNATAYFDADSPASAMFGVSPFGDTYITDNTINAGYNVNSTTAAYINYYGYHGGATQYRDLCISNGESASGNNCTIYTQGSVSRVGVLTDTPQTALDVTGTFRATGLASFPGGLNTTYGGTTGSLEVGTTGGTNNFAHVDGGTGNSYYTQTIVRGGFGFGTQNAPISPLDILGITNGTARTDQAPLLVNAIVQSGATYNTTAGALYPSGIFVDYGPTRTAGTNLLTNKALRLDARNGDVNVALFVDEGGMWLGQDHITYVARPSYAAGVPTVTSCGTGSPVDVGNDTRGRITVGGGTVTSCTLTFVKAYTDHTNTAITPSCTGVQAENGAVTSWVPSSTGLTITTGTSVGGSYIDYDCGGVDTNLPNQPET